MIKGPVAIAGSIPFLSKSIGIDVPISAATTITQSIESEIVILSSIGSLVAKPNKIVKIPKIIPFIKLSPSSFSNLFTKLPFTMSFAKP